MHILDSAPHWLASVLRRWAEWLSPTPPVVVSDLDLAARLCVAHVNAESPTRVKTSALGRWRFLTVERELRPLFPAARKRHIACAIENAVAYVDAEVV